MRFCNKHCEKEAHTKEKSTKKVPENPSDTEDLLEKEKKAEIKRKEKRKRRSIRAVKIATSSCFIPRNKHTLMMCEALKK